MTMESILLQLRYQVKSGNLSVQGQEDVGVAEDPRPVQVKQNQVEDGDVEEVRVEEVVCLELRCDNGS